MASFVVDLLHLAAVELIDQRACGRGFVADERAVKAEHLGDMVGDKPEVMAH